MHCRRSLQLSLFILVAIVTYLASSPSEIFAQSVAAPNDGSVASFLIRLGVNDTEARSWDGSLSVSNGEVVRLRNWRPRPSHQIEGNTSWKMGSEQGPNINWRANMSPPPENKPAFLWRPGIVVDLKTSPSTRVDVTTSSGRFSFQTGGAAGVRFGHPTLELDGSVIVERIPAAEKLSTSGYQNDFASMLSGSDGEVWVCWVAYSNNANEVLARRFDGSSWGAAQTVTEQPGDVFLAKMGRDKKGRPWVVWANQSSGNFDLYGRFLEDGSWSAVERLTTNPGNDVFHNLATDASGNLWLVWQSTRGRQSDIFARRYDGSSWSPEEKVSSSPANDWEPVIAAGGKGRVYVAWDTYDKGDYDVVMRSWANGEWAETSAVASTARYEAHISLAVDGNDRLWAAWNESGTNWGKDTGWVLNIQGTRLYEWRSIEVAVHDGKSWRQPAAKLDSVLPSNPSGFTDFPVLYPDGTGRMWLFFRNRTLRLRDNPGAYHAHRATWETWATTIDGDRWLPLAPIPFSRGRMDMRGGFADDGEGNIYAAWPTDNRDYEEFLFKHADVYAARLPAFTGSTQPVTLVPRPASEVAYFPFHPNDKEDVARLRDYKIESGGKTYRIYRGDTHRHSEFSMDGNNDGSLIQTYRYAIDAAELEYLLASDHNQTQGPDVPYINWLLQQMVDVMTIPGRFLPYYGYERSARYPNGHRNILFTKRGNPTLPMPEDERFGRKVGVAELYAYLKKYDGIVISHTSATNMGTDWSFPIDSDLEPLVEIYQGDRVSAEYEGAPRAAVAGNPYAQPGLFRPAGYVWNAWAKGYKLGVQAASDHVSTHISYACTIAEDFSRESMIDAMKKRHSYGATDNIILDYRLQADGKEYLQGDIVSVSGDFKLSVKIIGTAPIRQIDIIKNQTFLHNRQNLGSEVSFTFVDNNPGPGENYYYVRVVQQDGQMAWSSPIWVTGP